MAGRGIGVMGGLGRIVGRRRRGMRGIRVTWGRVRIRITGWRVRIRITWWRVRVRITRWRVRIRTTRWKVRVRITRWRIRVRLTTRWRIRVGVRSLRWVRKMRGPRGSVGRRWIGGVGWIVRRGRRRGTRGIVIIIRGRIGWG